MYLTFWTSIYTAERIIPTIGMPQLTTNRLTHGKPKHQEITE